MVHVSGSVKGKIPARFFVRAVNLSQSASLLRGQAPESVVLHVSLRQGGIKIAENLLYFGPVKSLTLPVVAPELHIKDLGGAFAIALSAPGLVKNLCLSLRTIDATFSDNYFDLLPGHPILITCKPARALSLKAFKAELEVMHMAQIV